MIGLYISSGLYGRANIDQVVASGIRVISADESVITCTWNHISKAGQTFTMRPDQFKNSNWIKCPEGVQLTFI